MENIHNDDNQDIEDVKIEEEALKETPAEEVKKEIMENYGFTEEEHSELIDKIVKDKLEERKKLGTAIKQKRNWRDKFNSIKPEEKKEEKKDKKELTQSEIDALVEQKLNEKLDSREIDSAELSDELKKQVKEYAILTKVSVKEAMKSEYIQFHIQKEKEKIDIEDASISNKRDKTKSNKNFKDMSPNDFDVSTAQGREDWAEYKKHLQSSEK